MFIIIIFIISCAFVGLLFDLTKGPWIGFIISLIVLSILSKWGEKIVLVFAKARYVSDDELLVNQVKNFSCHLNIKEVKIYWSNAFVNNVYFTDSRFGKPALIIGKNVYKQFTRNELNSLIYASLLKIKSGEAKNRTMVSLLFIILYSPIYTVRALLKSHRLHRNLDIFFYPAFSLKTLMYENERYVLNFDAEVGKFQGLKKDYIGAIFKVAHMPSFNEKTVGALVLAELSHSKNMTEDFLGNVLFKSVEIKTRMKALSSN